MNARYNNHKIGGWTLLTINQMVQLGSACMLLYTSALINWYQGRESNLIDNPDEWKYSAKFTNITLKAPFQITKIFIKSILFICSKILSNSIYRYAY